VGRWQSVDQVTEGDVNRLANGRLPFWRFEQFFGGDGRLFGHSLFDFVLGAPFLQGFFNTGPKDGVTVFGGDSLQHLCRQLLPDGVVHQCFQAVVHGSFLHHGQHFGFGHD
jgi:hypothetical protein